MMLARAWNYLLPEKRNEYIMYTKYDNFLSRVYNYFTKLWIDIRSLEPIMGDLFTYGSFIVLILSCGGMNLGLGISAKTIIQIIGAVCTLGSTALKVCSKISVLKTPQLFQVPNHLDQVRTHLHS
jgi:hypothetical protein